MVNYGPDDEYRPHCDGDCTGAVYRPGGRVATMVRCFSVITVSVTGRRGDHVRDVMLSGTSGGCVALIMIGDRSHITIDLRTLKCRDGARPLITDQTGTDRIKREAP